MGGDSPIVVCSVLADQASLMRPALSGGDRGYVAGAQNA